MLNTVVRQIAFYTFERKVHEARRQGELTADQLNAHLARGAAESLGPAIDLKPGYEVFWTYIPHFIHSPFYVYAYAFGDCLVNSLYGLYPEAHPGFVAKYFDMLKAGGSKHHSELLAPFGLDARDPAFWNKGLRVHRGHDRRAGGDGPNILKRYIIQHIARMDAIFRKTNVLQRNAPVLYISYNANWEVRRA